MTRAPRLALALAAVIFAAACGSSSEPTAPDLPLSGPSFSLSITGDVRTSVRGVPTALRMASGYREYNQSGQGETTAVVLVQLAPADASQPTLILGLMGPIQPGTYALHTVGSAVPGSKPEYYGLIVQRGSDGTRNYNATSGTVTLSAVGDTLRGTVTLHYGNIVFVPSNSPPGATYKATGASVDATGTFVVPAPTFTLP